MTTATLTRHDVEREKARRLLLYFLGFGRIQEPVLPNVSGSGGAIPFEMWPHLKEFAEDLLQYRLLVKGKARQLGFTWLVAAYLDWLCDYSPGTDGLWLSKSEPDAAEGLGRVATWHELMPPHLVTPWARPPASLTLEYANGSHLVAMASTENAGRGRAFSVVVQDEADYHPHLAENFAAVKPTIDSGGQLIMLSSMDKGRVDSLFRNIIRGAPGNGWHLSFTGWQARPGRDQAWYEQTKANVPASAGMSPELYMEQEYPGTIEEMLAPSRALAYFDVDSLNVALLETMPARETVGALSVWRKAVVGGKYILGADTAWGVTGSYNCAAVFDWQTNEQMAELHGRLHPQEMAYEVWQLHKAYNHAYMGVERAGEGQERDGDSVVVADKLVELLKECGCHGRLYYSDHDSPRPERPGWQTDARSRPVMLGEFREAMRNRQVVLRSRPGVAEMLSFIRNEKGRPEASKGAFDDRVVTYAIAWAIRGFARFSVSQKPVLLVNRW